ncbi:MAG: pyridoxamine 5'-phosphate oxidase family protein [Acidimicrobiia bacterium]
MSIPVDTTKLAAELDRYGLAPYLLSVTPNATAHCVHVAVTFDAASGSFTCDAGNRTRANITANAAVSLLFVAFEPDGYSLIVDGAGSVDNDAGTVTVAPTKAVLHRPAPASADGTTDPASCGSDCVPLT